MPHTSTTAEARIPAFAPREPNRCRNFSARAVQAACIAGGVPLNTAILLAPLIAVGRLHLAASDPLLTAFLLFASAFYLAEISATAYAHRRGLPPARSVDRRARRLALATGMTIVFIGWAGIVQRAVGLPQMVSWWPAGAAMMAAGIALRWSAIRGLGEHFVTAVTVPGRRPLIQGGIFARLRHPSESGLLLFTLGTAVFLGSTAAAALWLAMLLPLTFIRIRIEERCLLETFGDEYREYQRRVPALVPLVVKRMGRVNTWRKKRTHHAPRDGHS